MSLDLHKIENLRSRGDKLIARCPACAEAGADKAGEHLFIADAGRGPFGCIAHTGPTGEEHRKRIWELAGTPREGRQRPSSDAQTATKPPPRPSPQLPLLRPLTVTEMAQVAAMRGWTSFAGLEILTQRGLLFFSMVWDAGREWPAWIITDSSRRNLQARRLDGGLWQGIGGKKAKSLPGVTASWPIGAADIGEHRFVVLCEGQPDFCAAPLVAWWEGLDIDLVAPVCMTGAGQSIHPEAITLFAGKHVRITIHDDAAGHAAAHRWSDQLYRAGAVSVDGFDFAGMKRSDGRPVKDLADYATLLDDEGPPTPPMLRDLPGHLGL